MVHGPSDPIENKILPRGMLPLLPDQQLIWLFEQLNPGTCVYHIPLVYEVLGNIDSGHLKTALAFIQEHHPALNLVFSLGKDQVFQTQKKTTIRNNFKGQFSTEQWEAININPGHRPEQLDYSAWTRIALALDEH